MKEGVPGKSKAIAGGGSCEMFVISGVVAIYHNYPVWLRHPPLLGKKGIKKRPRGADVYSGHHMIYSSRIGQLFTSKYCFAFCALGRHSLIRD